MHKKHYSKLADQIGIALAIAIHGGQHDNFYNDVYVPLVDLLTDENPLFDRVLFGFAVAQSQEEYMKTTRLTYNEGR